MGFKFLLFTYAIVYIPLVFSKQPRKILILFNSINCTANDNYIHDISCQVSEPDHKGVSANMIFLRNIANSKLNIRIYLNNNSGMDSKPFVDANLNMCDILEGRYKSHFLKLLHAAIKQFTNYPQKCPFLKDETYYLQNVTMDASRIPPFVPATSFIVKIMLGIPSKGEILTAEVKGNLINEKNATQPSDHRIQKKI